MNYPIWEVTAIGGPTLIAIIAVLHAYIAHLAVGGGLFLWLTDWKGYKDNDPLIHQYVKKHLWFFLLLTMVFGGVTGVGIWFIIALVSPAATSTLIHNFVFGWAIEWVFFVGEIIALLVYYYKFHVMNRSQRLQIGFLYFLFAWLSLVVINGILAFMLTPGQWLQTGGFWDGFLNPTYFPSLLFRSFIAIMIAGLFGYVTTVFLKDSEFRTKMMRYCSMWLLIPAIGVILLGIWYYNAVPMELRHITFNLNPQTGFFVDMVIWGTVVVFLFGIFLSLKSNITIQRILTFVLIIIGLGWYGGFEHIREIARKPYIITDYMYSTSILKSDVAKLNKDGVLKHAKWVSVKEITPQNRRQAGRDLFNIQCLSCHSVGRNYRNDILSRTENFTYDGMVSHLTGQGKLQTYMPPFVGTDDEKEALAEYIIGELHRKEVVRDVKSQEITKLDPVEPPPFDPETDEYVLLAWNDKGVACLSDCDPWFTILPPGNTIEAVLIKRGDSPEVITEDVEISYQVEAGFENPANHVDFWKYSESLLGQKLEKNIGIKGNGLTGAFHYNEALDDGTFIAKKVPVLPYKDDGTFNPYPYFTIQATDAETGDVLVTTKVVTPTTTEMGCRNCHDGGWRKDVAGVSDETAANILKAHDRMNGTILYDQALDGKPKSCKSCHGHQDQPQLLSLSAAMHSFHANYMQYDGGEACVQCHPNHPKGATLCNRSIHATLGMNCTHCHGELNDHALSLLRGQPDANSTNRLMKHLTPQAVDNIDDINPRQAWVQQPDCMTCHEDYEKPEPGPTAFNEWTEGESDLYRIRLDFAEVIRCEACHNSPHAEYPTENPYRRDRDNFQPMQYSGTPYPIGSNGNCQVCHTVEMDESIHHENMNRLVRNMRESFE